MTQDHGPSTTCPLSSSPELALAALADAYPAFDFARLVYAWRGSRWSIKRRNGTHPGLYAIITPDLAELRDALILDEQQSGHSTSGPARAELWKSLI